MMNARRITFAATMLLALAALHTSGCSSQRPDRPIVRDEPPPSYADIARVYNERADRLDRVWARAVVRFDYEDDRGRMRREQGEGHLQYLAPGRLALSVGKLGETLFWLGCDEQRYWWFDLHESNQASIGRHQNLGRSCNKSLGLPAHPHDIIQLLGVTPLPTGSIASSARVGWSGDGRWIVVEIPGAAGYTQYFIDPQTYEPGWIKLLHPSERSPLVHAELDNYENVVRRVEGGFFPRMASRISIRTPDEAGEIRLTLSALSDGREDRGRLADSAFSFDALSRAYRPQSVVILDELCPQPAAGVASAPADSQ
ncbi:MAG: hypothetical protein EA376_10255 [Phycisphaeraceae bacterium]|nr:MAG: hypothetical protein EA376_10255 [Phycisphaeraceae bacterium]